MSYDFEQNLRKYADLAVKIGVNVQSGQRVIIRAGIDQAMLTRLIDHLKLKKITTLLTNLTSPSSFEVTRDVEISSLVDSSLLLRNLEQNSERHLSLCILKSRGMAHSQQILEFRITAHGVELQSPNSIPF